MTTSRSDRRNGWHVLREDGAVTIARHRPPRFDVAAETVFAAVRPARLAHQVRQDLWRALSRLRGFSPVVRVESSHAGLRVIAGGRVDGALAKDQVASRITALLEDPANRARWAAWARRGT